jgi:hypothetical protein
MPADHAQILFALQSRMELEVGGRPSFVDSACGMRFIPQVPATAIWQHRKPRCW